MGASHVAQIILLCSHNAVHNLGCSVVSTVISFDISRRVCVLCSILNDVMRHMRKDYRAPRCFRSCLSKADIY